MTARRPAAEGRPRYGVTDDGHGGAEPARGGGPSWTSGCRPRSPTRANAAIAQRLVITERAVAKHTASIFLKLNLQPSDDDNRRVLAMLAYLGG